jgi:hypothetical protein
VKGGAAQYALTSSAGLSVNSVSTIPPTSTSGSGYSSLMISVHDEHSRCGELLYIGRDASNPVDQVWAAGGDMRKKRLFGLVTRGCAGGGGWFAATGTGVGCLPGGGRSMLAVTNHCEAH